MARLLTYRTCRLRPKLGVVADLLEMWLISVIFSATSLSASRSDFRGCGRAAHATSEHSQLVSSAVVSLRLRGRVVSKHSAYVAIGALERTVLKLETYAIGLESSLLFVVGVAE